nr:hypothetical protein [uncultured Desulfobacter sp.]
MDLDREEKIYGNQLTGKRNIVEGYHLLQIPDLAFYIFRPRSPITIVADTASKLAWEFLDTIIVGLGISHFQLSEKEI